MSVKRKTEDTRGLALGHIAEYLKNRLGFRKGEFIEWFSEEGKGSKSEKTLWRYIRGDTAMKDWTFEQFWGKVEGVVEKYFEYDKEIGRPLAPNAAEIWEREKGEQEERCRFFFLDLNVPERAEDFPEQAKQIFETAEKNKKKLLELIKPIFEALDDGTAYSLQHNFLALATVTAEDCLFMAHILTRTEEEKEALKAAMLQGVTVDAGTMLACLQSEEVRCWVNMKERDYTGTAKKSKGIWEQFSDKFMKLTPLEFAHVSSFIEIPLLLALDRGGFEAEKVEVQLPSGDDIELLLLFKYCLTPEGRGQYLEI